MMQPNTDPSIPNTPASVTVHGPDGILAAVPVLLGFHPAESVVMVCTTGTDRAAIGPVVRVDLPSTPEATERVGRALADIAWRDAHRVVLVGYSDTPAALDTVHEVALWVEMWRPVAQVLTTGNAQRPTHEVLTAANVVHGRSVLPDRATLVRSVEADPRAVAPAELLAEFNDLHRRDALLVRLMPDRDAVAALVTLAQATPDSDHRAADVCAVLAALAYRNGDGGLARVAADRAQRIEPGHRLSRLIVQCMTSGLPPASLDTLTAA